MALTLSGDGDITGLAVGSLPPNVIGGGAVLQVVQTVKSDVFSSTSGSYVDITGMSASITPTSASSRIAVFISFTAGSTAINNIFQF